VSADGSRRLLGDYAGATWSPRGLFVAVWRGSELLAVEPGGRVRWSLARQGRVRAARWSPDGFRVAYLAGAQLRVVAGDGTGDRGFRRDVAAVAPAWRPNAPHLLAYAAGGRSVELVSTDLGARAWRSRLPATPRLLEWSPDGTVLAAADRTGVTLVHGTSGRVARRIHAAPGFAVTAIAFSPDGKRLAVAASSRNGTARLFTAGLGRGVPQRRLFAGSGTFSQAEWSPDGRWVMIAWPEADQWLFVRSSGQPGVSAVRGIARQFDPGRPSPAFPRLGDWCCA
jgi:dipeptidyl aminopeptidase/acylaminoacyl peptidase